MHTTMSFRTTQSRTVMLDDDNEEGAFSFVHKFINIGYESSFPMKICALKDALYDLLAISNKNKMLILYLHDEESDFSKRFCSYISNKEVGHILGEHFMLLGWDIGLEDYRDDLIKSIREFDQLEPCISVIEQGRSLAIFINLYDINFQICSILKEFDGIDGFVLTLNTLVDGFCRNIDTDTFETDLLKEPNDPDCFTCVDFQQKMCDELGNRDYDCFEPDELEFLKEKISFAFFGPPSDVTGYNNKQEEQTAEMYDKILEMNNEYAEYKNQVVIAVVYNCLIRLDRQDSLEFSPVPVFILRKCREAENPCRIVIDHTGRVYKSWTHYLEDNKFCECLMVFPEDGRYATDKSGKVKLVQMESPACGAGKKVLKVADITGSVLGIGSTSVVAAAAIPAITIAPILVAGAVVTGATVGLYSVGRSIHTLVDRALHKESMNVKKPEARGAYIGIAAGAVGMAGAGANMLVAQAAASGIAIGTAGRLAANSINIANIGIGGLAIGNSAVEIAMRWWIDDETPSTLSVLQLGASIFFFGHAVYNFKTAGTIIEENQTTVLDDYKSTLRSNRHRKMFDKLLKETINENGNLLKGRSEVISALKNIGNNKDDVFAFLARNNGKINELGIKFSAKDGGVTLNDIPIDLSEINSISRSDFAGFYADLSSRASVPGRVSSIRNLNIDMSSFMSIENFTVISRFVSNLISCETVEEKVLLVLRAMLQYFRAQNGEVWQIFKLLDEMMPKNEFPRKLTELILCYIQSEVENLINRNGIERTDQQQKLYFMRSVCDGLLLAFRSPTDSVLKLIAFSTQWIVNAYMEYEEKKQRNDLLEKNERRDKKSVCTKCSGYYFEG